MNVWMNLCDSRSDKEFAFFSKLREQGIATITTSSLGGEPWYVSSKFLIEMLSNWIPPARFMDRKFLARERDVPLILLMTEYRVEVCKLLPERVR